MEEDSLDLSDLARRRALIQNVGLRGLPLFSRKLIVDTVKEVTADEMTFKLVTCDGICVEQPNELRIRADEQLDDSPGKVKDRFINVVEFIGYHKLVGNDTYQWHQFLPVTISWLPLPMETDIHPMSAARTFAYSIIEWERSQHAHSLVARMEDIEWPKIDKVICFALGDPFETAFPDEASRLQHAAALTIATTLEKKTGVKPKVMVQDPMLSNLSKGALNNLGIEVIDGTYKGFLMVDDSSFVFSLCPGCPVRQVVADLATPAGMLWHTSYSELEQDCLWTSFGNRDRSDTFVGRHQYDPSTPRTREMIKKYDEYEMPDLNSGYPYFGDVSVCVRKASSVAEGASAEEASAEGKPAEETSTKDKLLEKGED